MAKKLSKQHVKDYVELYIWLKKEMKKPEWREFTAYIHGKAGYHDVANTYINFLKEFESATRGYIENFKIKSSDDLNDTQIEHLANVLSNVSDDADLTRFNLMLGNVFGESAGRYKALMTAMEAEARAAKLEEMLAAEKAKNEQLRNEGKKVDDTIVNNIIAALKNEYTTINTNIANIITTNETQTTEISKLTKVQQKLVSDIHNTKQTVLTELSQIMLAIQQFDADYSSVVGNIQNIDVNIANINSDIEIIKKQNDEILAILRAGGAGAPPPPKKNSWIKDPKTWVLGGVALALLGTTIWAGTYHEKDGDAATPIVPSDPSTSINWEDKYTDLNNSYAQLDTLYKQLLQDYEAIKTSPSHAALIKYINLREKLDVQIILALNDGSVTKEESDQIYAIVENITTIDLAITTANPSLGEVISSLLSTLDKLDMAITTLNAKITELEGVIANTDDKKLIAEYLEQIEKLKNEKQTAISTFNDYKASHSTSNEDVEKMKADYEAKLQEKAQEVIALQNRVDELVAKLANAKTKEEYDKLYADYTATLDALEISDKNYYDLYDAFESYKIETNKTIQGLRETVAAHEKTIAELNKTIQDKQAIIDAYEAQGPSSGITQEEYNAAVKAKEDAEKAKVAAEKALAGEQKAHDATKKLLDEAKATISSLNTKISDLRKAYNDYVNNHSYSDAEVKAIQDAYDLLADQYDILREQLANATTPEEMQAISAKLTAFENVANMAYKQFYGTAGTCTPEQLAAILAQFGFNVEQNPGDPSNNIYQPGN